MYKEFNIFIFFWGGVHPVLRSIAVVSNFVVGPSSFAFHFFVPTLATTTPLSEQQSVLFPQFLDPVSALTPVSCLCANPCFLSLR